jgi:hypothetical protein
MGLLKELKANQNLVLELERGYYKSGLAGANKIASDNFNSICYIALSKPAAAVKDDLKKGGVDVKKYDFVDCISKKSRIKKLPKNTTFISSPKALTELAIVLSKKLHDEKFDMVLLDSISSMLVYNTELSVVKFLHFLMIAVKSTKAKAIYVIMRNDLARKGIREIELFADNITWLE